MLVSLYDFFQVINSFFNRITCRKNTCVSNQLSLENIICCIQAYFILEKFIFICECHVHSPFLNTRRKHHNDVHEIPTLYSNTYDMKMQ